MPEANDAFKRSYPGGKSFNTTMNIQNPAELPSIVKTYRSVVQSRIRKRMFGVAGGYAGKDYIFQSVVPTWAPGTANPNRSMKIFIMPGRHSASASLDPQSENSGLIAQHLCATFLKENGTEMKLDFTLSSANLFHNLRELMGKLDGDDADKTGYKASPSKKRGQLIRQIQQVAQDDEQVDLIKFAALEQHFLDLQAENNVEEQGYLAQLIGMLYGAFTKVATT